LLPDIFLLWRLEDKFMNIEIIATSNTKVIFVLQWLGFIKTSLIQNFVYFKRMMTDETLLFA